MKFKPVNWRQWKWSARFKRPQGRRQSALDAMFPLCFVPESRPARRAD